MRSVSFYWLERMIEIRYKCKESNARISKFEIEVNPNAGQVSESAPISGHAARVVIGCVGKRRRMEAD